MQLSPHFLPSLNHRQDEILLQPNENNVTIGMTSILSDIGLISCALIARSQPQLSQMSISRLKL